MPRKQSKPGGKFIHKTLIRDTVAILQDEWGWNAGIDNSIYKTDSGQEVRPDVVAIPPNALRLKGEKLGWLEFQTTNIRAKNDKANERYYDGLNRTFSEPLVIAVDKVWDDSTAKRFDNLRQYLNIRYPRWKRRN